MKDKKYASEDLLYYSGKLALEHRCDEWVIGSIDDAKALIEDLHKAIAMIEAGMKPRYYPPHPWSPNELREKWMYPIFSKEDEDNK